MNNQTEPKLEHYLSMIEGMRTNKSRLRKNIFRLLNEIYEIKNREEDEIKKNKKCLYELKETIKQLESIVKSKNEELVKLQKEIDSYEVIDEITEKDLRDFTLEKTVSAREKKQHKIQAYMVIIMFFCLIVCSSLFM
jgi:t-SNARE complex subunit (syntaxin)